MPDIYSDISAVPDEVQQLLSDSMVTRAAEPEQVAMRRRYFSWLDLPKGGRGIEIGSGPGDVSADLLAQTALAEVVGLDPSPVMSKLSAERFGGTPGLSFVEGDGRDTGLGAESFDLVVFHTVLCHVPGPDKALAEAFRLLKPGGTLAIFDGDYATTTVETGDDDPLQGCMRFIQTNLIHDMWLCRKLPGLVTNAGFRMERRDAHGYFADSEARYFLTLVDRGADFMGAGAVASPETVAALKAEARARVAASTFFGFISFNSFIARKLEHGV